jgi:dTDP-4-dehydrorhamnose 3,5-epimerase
MLEVRETALPGVLEILPRRIGDDRGFFSEVWSEPRFREAGFDIAFVQDNHSRSARGVLRGLHYQLEPFAQNKLVRVTRGSVYDVAVDIRRSSPTFGKWTGGHPVGLKAGTSCWCPPASRTAFLRWRKEARSSIRYPPPTAPTMIAASGPTTRRSGSTGRCRDPNGCSRPRTRMRPS